MMDDTEVVLNDEQDVFNDETFGGGDEYNWEPGEPPEDMFDSIKNSHCKTGLQATGLDPTPFTPVKEAPDYFTNEEQDGDYMNVEESISRLVLDDDVDDIENERDRFIKASHKSLMPPQVINRNLTWLADKDLGNPLFGSSVWSMHPTDVLRHASTTATSVLGTVPPLDTIRNLPLECQESPNRPPPGLENKPMNHRTVEEIEQELLSCAPTNKYFRDVNLSGIGRGISNSFTISQDLNENTQTLELKGSERHPSAFIRATPPRSFAPGYVRPPEPVGLLGDPPLQVGYPPGFPGGLPYMMNQRPSVPFMRPRMPHGQFPPPRGYGFPRPQRYSGDSESRYQQPIRNAYSQQAYARMSFSAMPRVPHPHLNGGIGGNRSRFDGLMTEKDKQRLRNIQMLQLQNDHPYTTDYYYQMRKYNLDSNKEHLRKVFPSAADLPERNPYEPTRFENALGKLQAVSALAPKRVMDTYLQVYCSTVHGPNSPAKILSGIEAVYRLYLDVKEFKYRKIADTLDEEHNHRREFLAFSKILWELDKQGDSLYGWMSFRKGRDLLHKLVIEFSRYEKGRNAAYMILTNMLKYISLRNMKRMEARSDLFQICGDYCHFILEADVVQTDLLLQGIKHQMWRSSFGCSVFLLILEQAATHILNGSIGISWSTFKEHLEESKCAPSLVASNNDTFKGFLRLPSALRSFLDEKLEDMGSPVSLVDCKGLKVEAIMMKSGNAAVLDYLQKRRRVFCELEEMAWEP